MIQDLAQQAIPITTSSVLPHIAETVAMVAAVLGGLKGYDAFKAKKNGNPEASLGEIKLSLERIEEGNKEIVTTMTEMRIEMAKLRARHSQ